MIDLNNKLSGFPHVYYFNMDEEKERRDYMETQFKNYDIKYTRISGNRFKAAKIKDWKGVLYNQDCVLRNLTDSKARIISNFVSHLFFFKEWYQSTKENEMILMEDDYDLSLIDYWHFDWNYFVSRIPFDWDTVQLGYEHFEKVEFFLSHKDYRSFNFGPTLINRNHIKKILDLFFINDKIQSRENLSYGLYNDRLSVDDTINHLGKNYTIPLITTNTDFFQNDGTSTVFRRHHTNRYIYYYWWKNKRDDFSLDDFFTMNKPNDINMTEYLHNYESRALSF